MTIRFFMLQAHYRSTLDFSNAALRAAEKGFSKLMNAMETLNQLVPAKNSTYNINKLEKNCYSAMNDDFNTPILIAHLFDGVKLINSIKKGNETLNISDLNKLKSIFSVFVTEILGLISIRKKSETNLTNKLMNIIMKLRGSAKRNKNFETADLIRDELTKINIEIKDTKEGSDWEIK